MSAAPSEHTPLAPAIYFESRHVSERFHWWYRVLVAKICRLCTGTLTKVGSRGKLGQELGPILLVWEKAFEVLFSKDWLATLNLEQLEAIYGELHTFAELFFAINARWQSGNVRASVIATAVCCPSLPCPPVTSAMCLADFFFCPLLIQNS